MEMIEPDRRKYVPLDLSAIFYPGPLKSGPPLFQDVVMIATVSRWVSLMFRDPVEFYDRIRIVSSIKTERRFGTRSSYDTMQWAEAVEYLAGVFGNRVHEILAEDALAELEAYIVDRMSSLSNSDGSTPHVFNADRTLSRLCYLACRLIQPELVLETGVGYGSSTVHFLRAMQVNGKGRLISIDLPPLRPHSEEVTGYLVPDDLRHRWDFRRGSVERMFNGLLPELDRIDIFLHDSARTRSLMEFEFNAVLPLLAENSAILSNSIGWNEVFLELVQRTNPVAHAYVQQVDKNDITGACFLRRTNT